MIKNNEQYIHEFKASFEPFEITEYFKPDFYFKNSILALELFRKNHPDIKGVKFNINMKLNSDELIDENGNYIFDLTQYIKSNTTILDAVKVESEYLKEIIKYNTNVKEIIDNSSYLLFNPAHKFKYKLAFNSDIKENKEIKLTLTVYLLVNSLRKEIYSINDKSSFMELTK